MPGGLIGLRCFGANGKFPEVMKRKKFAMNIWRKNTEITEKYTEAGRFSAIIGYVWTSKAGDADNLQRNVICAVTARTLPLR